MRYDVINDTAALQSRLFLHKKYPALGNSVRFIFIHNLLLMDLIRLRIGCHYIKIIPTAHSSFRGFYQKRLNTQI